MNDIDKINKIGYEIAKNLAKKSKELELFVRCKEKYRIPLMTKPNVIGLGIGQRIRKGELVDELVVKVYVIMKVAQDLLPKEQLIPSELDFENNKVPTDVEESDIPEAAQLVDGRFRPLRGGTSIGPETGGGGTLGICVTLDDDRTYILSNNHVLAKFGNVPIGTRIVQPSIGDGGSATPEYRAVDDTRVYDEVAVLSRYHPIGFKGEWYRLPGYPFPVFGISTYNHVDCALAECALPGHVPGIEEGFNIANREIHWIGYPSPKIAEDLSDTYIACKMGRTTGFTTGFIVDTSYDNYMDFSDSFGNPKGTNMAYFVDQIRIMGADERRFCYKGDSGSLVLDAETLKPTGLLFGLSKGGLYGICNRIGNVMKALGINRI